MTPFKIFACNPLTVNLKAAAAQAILLAEELPYEVKVDSRQTMLLSKGRVSPKNGWVVVTPGESVLTTIADLVEYIQQSGLGLD